jgi:hypothetical protein
LKKDEESLRVERMRTVRWTEKEEEGMIEKRRNN